MSTTNNSGSSNKQDQKNKKIDPLEQIKIYTLKLANTDQDSIKTSNSKRQKAAQFTKQRDRFLDRPTILFMNMMKNLLGSLASAFEECEVTKYFYQYICDQCQSDNIQTATESILFIIKEWYDTMCPYIEMVLDGEYDKAIDEMSNPIFDMLKIREKYKHPDVEASSRANLMEGIKYLNTFSLLHARLPPSMILMFDRFMPEGDAKETLEKYEKLKQTTTEFLKNIGGDDSGIANSLVGDGKSQLPDIELVMESMKTLTQEEYINMTDSFPLILKSLISLKCMDKILPFKEVMTALMGQMPS